MSRANLNLARKWRSRNFDQIVGQDLCVRMLKNSLYLGQYFPVYLFSGQRGCGKTTTARVFAAAINCDALTSFQRHPKKSFVPCLECESCIAILAGKHPDFIEIDAASHTGVDNVRQIIDASQLLPLMGKKKIYLIDEAHMLSKAAFNAFLKILEEPPSSVLFILATTDPQKIIDTVKSRCFQLYFKPVSHDPLLAHLKKVCDKEEIAYEDSALALIIKETQGSVRDALNVIEQVRFARGRLTKESVSYVLGHIDDEQMLKLFDLMLNKRPHDLLKFLQEQKFSQFSAEFVWNKIIEMVRAALWLKYDVQPEWFLQYASQLGDLVRGVSPERLSAFLKKFYANEQVFLKTTAKHSLLEMILLQVCQKNIIKNSDPGSSPASQNASSPVIGDDQEDEEQEFIEEEEEEIEQEEKADTCPEWKQFLATMDSLNDPLLISIFKNGNVLQFDKNSNELSIEFAKQFAFFQETIDETKVTWLPLLQKAFNPNVTFCPKFVGEQKIKEFVPKVETISLPPARQVAAPVERQKNRGSGFAQRGRFSNNNRSARTTIVSGPKVDISDADIWKKANMITHYFPGSVSEVLEG